MTLGDLVINGKVKIVISELIKREWQRNRVSAQDLIKKIENCRDGIVSQLEKIKKTLNGTVNNEIDIAAIKRKYNDEIKRNQTHIERVESLLLGSEVYTVSKETKITVTDWALDKKDPLQARLATSVRNLLRFNFGL